MATFTLVKFPMLREHDSNGSAEEIIWCLGPSRPLQLVRFGGQHWDGEAWIGNAGNGSGWSRAEGHNAAFVWGLAYTLEEARSLVAAIAATVPAERGHVLITVRPKRPDTRGKPDLRWNIDALFSHDEPFDLARLPDGAEILVRGPWEPPPRPSAWERLLEPMV